MKTVIVLIGLFYIGVVKAQSVLPARNIDKTQLHSITVNSDSVPQKKWFVSKYAGMSTSFNFFKGGNAMITAVPVGIQLNRKLNNNWYAFAGIAAAPAYINFNHSFLTSNMGKYGQSLGVKANRFDLYSRAELGLMYMNEQKTFSISGSIGVERSSYPLLPYYQPVSLRPAYFGTPYR